MRLVCLLFSLFFPHSEVARHDCPQFPLETKESGQKLEVLVNFHHETTHLVGLFAEGIALHRRRWHLNCKSSGGIYLAMTIFFFSLILLFDARILVWIDVDKISN